MDGYSLRLKLKKARRRYHLSIGALALYQELIDVCNEEGWPIEFKCSNGELQALLSNINEKSLKVYRDELITADLIFYESGKSKKIIGTYSLDEERISNYRKIYAQSDSPKDSQADSQNDGSNDSPEGENTTDIYKTKTEIKTETKNNSLPVKKPVDNKKKNIGSKRFYWKEFTETWFDFYEREFLLKPSFNGTEVAALSRIYDSLKKLSIEKKVEWNEENGINCFKDFLNEALKDNWLRENFLLPTIASKFDAIVKPVKKPIKTFASQQGKVLITFAEGQRERL